VQVILKKYQINLSLCQLINSNDNRKYTCCGLAPVRSEASPCCSLTPRQKHGSVNQKGESEKTCRLRKRQFNNERKSYVCKQSKIRNLFTTSHRQAGVQPSPGKQGSITHSFYLGKKTQHNFKCALFFLLPCTFYC